MSKFTDKRDGKGTKEWSDKSHNICLGCEHYCLYCYAWARRCRFDPDSRQPGGWQKQRLNPNKARLGAEVGPVGKNGKRGVVMFPTSHDITPRFLPEAVTTIKNLLVNNDVLVVSKPHLPVVKVLCRELKEWRERITFRFTIGSLDKTLSAFWEPGAPPPAERVAALKHAFQRGFTTSVSCEPMLDDGVRMVRLVAALEDFVTDTIWLGKAQRIPTKYNAHVPGFAAALAKLKAQQTDDEILKLVKALKGNQKVRWKDSITAVRNKHKGAPRKGNGC
jgi:DNA repair photolyase